MSDELQVPTEHPAENQAMPDPFLGAHRRAPLSGTDSTRIAELEKENQRLQLLVAELLIKNQQLRKAG